MEKCPFCAEMIPEDAGICPVCQKNLTPGIIAPNPNSINKESEYPVDPIALIAFVISISGFLLIFSSMYWLDQYFLYSPDTVYTLYLSSILFNPFPLASVVFTIIALVRLKTGKYSRGKYLTISSLIINSLVIALLISYLFLVYQARNDSGTAVILQNIQKFIVTVMGS